jgi:parvulin-like peptidyl-prolyl isomerase
MRSDMKRLFTSIVLFLMLLAGAPVRAEVIDRIVAVMNNSFIITLSDIRQERAIQAALGRQAGDDDAVLESLIEKRFFNEQIALFRDIEVQEDEVEQQMRGIRIPPGLSADDIRNTIREEIRRREFTIQRFRAFVKVTDEEVQDVYQKTVLPELRAAGGPMPSVEQGMDMARTVVIVDKMNKEVDEWLKDLRKRASIEKISQ